MRRVFGYGSLVNRRTHAFGGDRVVLRGWRRVWVTTAARPAAFLSAEPWEGEIEGLAFDVPDSDWPELLKREAQYDALQAGDAVVFSVPAANQTAGQAPILRSYLDVVFQGYLAELGADALPRFLETTASWERGIHDDRADPIYPRAQVLTAAETALFDEVLDDFQSIPTI